MKKSKIIYLIITLLFILVTVIIMNHTNLSNNVEISKAVQIIMILYLVRISYGCTLYLRKEYSEKKYSYEIVMNLGLLIFININIIRQVILLITNWSMINIIDIYNNTLDSFSFFTMLVLPCIIVLSIYSIITNVVLIKKEGFRYRNILGIVLGSFVFLGTIGSQYIYLVTSNILAGSEKIIIKKAIDIMLNVTFSYFYTLIIASLYCNIRAAKHIPKYDKDFVIILGSKINNDGSLTPLLKGRVDKAIEFGEEQLANTKKKIYYIPSGGKGKDEVISEGEAIKKYLIKQGINKKYILVEDKSTSTVENMKYSNNIIVNKKKAAKVCFSTTNYHVFRSGVIATNCGIDCEGMGSNTKWYFYANALIREFIANFVQEKGKHIALIIIINISVLNLIVIGYFYNLISLQS